MKTTIKKMEGERPKLNLKHLLFFFNCSKNKISLIYVMKKLFESGYLQYNNMPL